MIRNGGRYYCHEDIGLRKNNVKDKGTLPSILGNRVTKARSIRPIGMTLGLYHGAPSSC